jgi:hypothetical protein
MNSLEYQTRLETLPGVLRPVAKKECWQLMQKWRELFARDYHAMTGKWGIGDFQWHLFSFNYARALAGERAVAEYLSQPLQPFYLVPEESAGLPGFHITASTWPDLRCWMMDIYVFPEKMEWTMAFTHEPDSGPYFASCPNQ